MKKIFIAFTGPKIKQQAIFRMERGFECWNLGKLSLDEFVKKIIRAIPPINRNVLRNYKKDEGEKDPLFGLDEPGFNKSSWGLLLPDDIPDSIVNGYSEILFLLSLYSPNYIYPVFHVTNLGITKLQHKKNQHLYFHGQNQSKIFRTSRFVMFFKKLLPQSVYGTWQRYRCEKWNQEDWRLFVAALMFSELKDYENEKQSITWQREAADMITIMESLFTAGDDTTEEIGYRLRKRIATLIGFKFPEIEKDVKKLYQDRSSFVHGSFFKAVAKGAKKEKNSVLPLALPDFKLLYKHKEYVRFALLAYINLAFMTKMNKFTGLKRPIDVLEGAIIDLRLRKRVIGYTAELFKLLPTRQFINLVN